MKQNLRILFITFLIILIAIATVAVSATPKMELTVYYGQVREQMEPVLKAFSNLHTEIEVKSFRAPTEELVTTAEMELRAGKPKFDVICAGSAQLLTLQQRYTTFKPFSPVDGGHIIKGLRDKSKVQIPIGTGFYVIEYNTKLITKEQAPKKWSELLNPEWNNKIVLADPKSSASIYGFVWYITQKLKGKPYGWSYFDELKKLNPKYVASHGTIGEMVSIGERPVGIQLMAVVDTAVAKGDPIWWNFPQDGIPTEVNMVSIRKNSPNQKAAEAFVNFMVSKDGQLMISKYMGYVPIRNDVSFTFKDGSKLKDIKLISRDDNWISENRADIIQRFQNIAK